MDNAQDTDVIEMTYQLSDLYAVFFQAWRHFLRVLLIVEALWIALIVIMNLIDGAPILDAIQSIYWPLLGWGGLVLLGVWFGLCPIIGYVRTKRRGFLGPTRLSLSERGISIETPKIESLVHWSAIKRVSRSRDRLFLFLTSASAVVVPRRAFEFDYRFDGWRDYALRSVSSTRTESVTAE